MCDEISPHSFLKAASRDERSGRVSMGSSAKSTWVNYPKTIAYLMIHFGPGVWFVALMYNETA